MDKLETAKGLAKAHFEIDENLRRVFLLEPLNTQDPEEPIKLLEVVEGTLEIGIQPVGFVPAPERGIPYPSVIIEISPREYEAIKEGTLGFGDRGWTLGPELIAS